MPIVYRLCTYCSIIFVLDVASHQRNLAYMFPACGKYCFIDFTTDTLMDRQGH